MDLETNFWLIWVIYGVAASLFYWLFWQVTGFNRARWLSYSIRGLMLALIVTPWYANTEGSTMAPALMVMTLDTITIGTSATSRAMVPLLLSLIAAEFMASLLYLVQKSRKKA